MKRQEINEKKIVEEPPHLRCASPFVHFSCAVAFITFQIGVFFLLRSLLSSAAHPASV